MKTKRFLLFPLFCLLIHFAFGQEPVEAVVRANRVYILKDETPVKELVVHILDARGKAVYEYTFCNEDTQWYLELPALPAGNYRVSGNGKVLGQFVQQGEKELRS